ncbi:unnamed protein product [Ostreobium quekettii]|uniref:peptidyl-tRNA hydrolase n=1 Tax=Ostreobium quekettii TaxID=121088 RepID=A0A8S1J902_9CHLO|nr:unnamed protein product [Ostreobium quekettii]|eukprot:evm.model.scf_2314.2 EVM.evm.TU.scf_2314.2   scf_2314:13284-18083(+)
MRPARPAARLPMPPLRDCPTGCGCAALLRACCSKLQSLVAAPRRSPWPIARDASSASTCVAARGIAAGLGRPEAAAGAGKGDGEVMVVGLGNPGPKYADTRHNVGFMIIDELARQEGIPVSKTEHNALVGRAMMCGRKVLLAKPKTFMNNSGKAVAALSKYYKISSDRILVIFDDLDLPTATVRLRASGGTGGHNGMKSIVAQIGTKEFPRLKIGIGRPSGRKEVVNHVLEPFGNDEKAEISIAIKEAADVVRAVLSVGVMKAVSGVRSR